MSSSSNPVTDPDILMAWLLLGVFGRIAALPGPWNRHANVGDVPPNSACAGVITLPSPSVKSCPESHGGHAAVIKRDRACWQMILSWREPGV